MDFLSVPNLFPWLIFRAWIVTDQFCWIRSSSTWQIKEREDGKRGGEGWLFKGGDYFQYFHQRGAFWYSREAINGGTAIIQGNMVLIPLSRDFICAEFLVRPWFGDFISRMGVSVFEWLLRKGVPWVDHCPPSSVSREWAQIQTRMISSIQAHGMILLAAMTLPKFSWVLMFNYCPCLGTSPCFLVN